MAKSLIVYIVQDLNGDIYGVYKTLKEAMPRFKDVYEEGAAIMEDLLVDDFDESDPFNDCEDAPMISVWGLNVGYLDMYENLEDIERALAEGEQYD